MTTTELNNNQGAAAVQNPAQILAHREMMEKAIKELSHGVDISAIDLNRNYGSNRMAIIADSAGKIVIEKDPFGNEKPVVLLVDGTWQMADGINAKLKSIPNASKFFVWRWDHALAKYIPDRTPYDADGKAGNEGTFEQFVRRHSAKSNIISLPGAAELGFLAKAATEIAKQIKDDKGKIPNDAAARVMLHVQAFFKAAGIEGEKARTIVHKAMPELWETKK